MKRWKLSPLALCVVSVSLKALDCMRRRSRSPYRVPAAGSFYSPLSPHEQAFFNQAAADLYGDRFRLRRHCREEGKGLGPTFNGNSCAQCHAQPAIGAAVPGSPAAESGWPNPQVALAALDGALNSVPSFISPNGPVREPAS